MRSDSGMFVRCIVVAVVMHDQLAKEEAGQERKDVGLDAGDQDLQQVDARGSQQRDDRQRITGHAEPFDQGWHETEQYG